MQIYGNYFTREDADLLVLVLQTYCPVDTGSLRDFGIQAYQTAPGEWKVVIGVNAQSPSGRNPSQYASFTNYRNETTKGWVEYAIETFIKLWKQKKGIFD